MIKGTPSYGHYGLLELVTCRSVCREIRFGNQLPTGNIVSANDPKSVERPGGQKLGLHASLLFPPLGSTQLSKQFQAGNMEQLDTNTRLADAYDTHIRSQQVQIGKDFKKDPTHLSPIQKYQLQFLSTVLFGKE